MTNKEDSGAVLAGCIIVFLWALGALFSLGLTATVIWAIIELVKHFTN